MYDYRDFAENGHSNNSYFREKLKKAYIGSILKNPGIHPS